MTTANLYLYEKNQGCSTKDDAISVICGKTGEAQILGILRINIGACGKLCVYIYLLKIRKSGEQEISSLVFFPKIKNTQRLTVSIFSAFNKKKM